MDEAQEQESQLIHASLGKAIELGEHSSNRLEDLVALNLLPELPQSCYIPWTTSSIRPSSLQVVLNEIFIHQRKVIVECGAGISTIYIASILEENDAVLYSIDHSEEWMEVVKSQMDKSGVSKERVTFIHAPLAPSDATPQGKYWYDTGRLLMKCPVKGVDLLLVDGPIGGIDGMAHGRYPALPFFKPRMADNFAVFLDDCHREGEMWIARKWIEEFELKGVYMPEKGDICSFRQKGVKAFNII
ncbi:MAG: class I SAM-dependent methyltransferase [Verrucomicrobiota bacterium]